MREPDRFRPITPGCTNKVTFPPFVHPIGTLLTLKGRGYFTNEKDGRGGGALWPQRQSRLVVMERG